MKFWEINKSTKYSDITYNFGLLASAKICSANGIKVTPEIGEELHKKHTAIRNGSKYDPKIQSKSAGDKLNEYSGQSDIFQRLALQSDDDWAVTIASGGINGHLSIPDDIKPIRSLALLGDAGPITAEVRDKAYSQIIKLPYKVDPSIFATNVPFVAAKSYTEYHLAETNAVSGINPMQVFNLPWGKISLYSSLSDMSLDIPAYPEELSDSRNANYTTMPDLLYQYEPWQVYESSGPRSGTYTFKLHRDMWTGNHNDGYANRLIRFCEANCYPQYTGSIVETSLVTLYINGKNFITGVLKSVNVDWSGPIGHDGWYLAFDLKLDITEVSKQPLNYQSVMSMPLIGE